MSRDKKSGKGSGRGGARPGSGPKTGPYSYENRRLLRVSCTASELQEILASSKPRERAEVLLRLVRSKESSG